MMSFTSIAHTGTGDSAHPHYDWSVKPPERIAATWLVAQAAPPVNRRRTSGTVAAAEVPTQARPFQAFEPRVTVRWDDSFLYIESNGLPTHGMMVGITAWQQQVPLPQLYVGDNAWRIPRQPVPSDTPVSIKGRFLRGAIAIAANGIPIFNPQNNRGELSQEIGELDEWGGHCGRADDYHYHAAPFHLQKAVGASLPIAFALDGYPIYGVRDPDGTKPGNLDAFNGHVTASLGYHYHGSTTYPYVNGGFHGVIVEREGQVDPQPRAQSVREALSPLRGARITGFTVSPDEKTFALQYTVNERTAGVNYVSASAGLWDFTYLSPDGTTREERYRAGERRAGSTTKGGAGGKKKGERKQ